MKCFPPLTLSLAIIQDCTCAVDNNRYVHLWHVIDLCNLSFLFIINAGMYGMQL